ALMAPPGSGKTSLAAQIVERRSARFIADPGEKAPAVDAGDSPSRRFERQIQFLDRRRKVLDSGAWPADARLSISDFYFDQALVYARIELDDAGFAAFRRAWHEASQTVVHPGLVVLLDDPPQRAPEPRWDQSCPSLSAGLAQLAARRGTGPVLYAGRADRQAQ